MKALLVLYTALIVLAASTAVHGPYHVPGPIEIARVEPSMEMLAADAARQHGISHEFLLAVCTVESGLNPDVRPGADGELGICQIKVTTWTQFDCQGTGREKPREGFNCAAKILKDRIRECGSEFRAAASYNVGTSECPANLSYTKKVSVELNRIWQQIERNRRMKL